MVDFVVIKGEEVWALIVKFMKKTYQIILKTVTHTTQAASKVFEYMKVGIGMLIEWVGFLFNWRDIVATENVFVNLTTSGLLWSVNPRHRFSADSA